MEARTQPNRWIILKLEDIYKVFAMWSGGYLDPDAWQLNSGIKSVEDAGEFWLFNGFSGSVYQCRKDGYGTTGSGGMIVSSWMQQDPNIEIMPSDFDPMTISTTAGTQ